jgi:hypothetical protein
MEYKKIIADSWEFTNHNKKLIIWYGFIPAIFTTAFEILYLSYQFFAFRSSPLFSNSHETGGFLGTLIKAILNFLYQNKEYATTLTIIAIVLGLLYLFIPTIMQGGLIQIIARIRNGQKVKVGDGLSYGLLAFLPMFEYHAMVKTFSFSGIIFEAAFILRNLPDWFDLFLPILIIFLVIGLFLGLLFTYAEYFIVIDGDKCGVFDSMIKSSKLVILNLKHTVLIGILMLIISIRIIINAIIILIIPIIIFFIVGYFATLTLAALGIIIGGIIGLVALFFAAYFTGTLHVFAATVWVVTFLEMTETMDKSAREKE